ncbi:MAG: DUF763 domain-containing protein [Bacteroidia bacterium]|nr:DUF763 domain-containing protein [Bacteroidia bacterium]
MNRSGSADLTLMGGSIPKWLFERMKSLSGAIVEAILLEYGYQGFLSRISDPFWFQSFGAVIGMDWNSSGVTTSVMRALKMSINPIGPQLGLYVCGGKGKESLQTPHELMRIADATGLDGNQLSRNSKLVAKVDNTALQDGYQLYLHNFLISEEGDWTVIQQGMNPKDQSARRYHWHSQDIDSFVDEPHSGVVGENQGKILNLTSKEAKLTREGILSSSKIKAEHILKELPKLSLPKYYGIKAGDIDMKRLEAILRLSKENETQNFEELLLLNGLGPRTLQSLTLVSELIHGTPSRFSDPARFTFAHGSKGGNPFPVPTKVYDDTIQTLRKAVDMAKIGQSDKQKAIRKLSNMSRNFEKSSQGNQNLEKFIEIENKESWKYGGKTVNGNVERKDKGQLNLFDED